MLDQPALNFLGFHLREIYKPFSDATFIIGLSNIGVIYSHLLDLVLCEYVLQHDTIVFLDL